MDRNGRYCKYGNTGISLMENTDYLNTLLYDGGALSNRRQVEDASALHRLTRKASVVLTRKLILYDSMLDGFR